MGSPVDSREDDRMFIDDGGPTSYLDDFSTSESGDNFSAAHGAGFDILSPTKDNLDCLKPSSSREFMTMPPRRTRRRGRDTSPPPNYDAMNRLSEWVEGSVVLRPNKSIELDDEDFFRIQLILQDQETTQVFLRGWRFRRMASMNGLLTKYLNEVCLVFDLTEGENVVNDRPFRVADGNVANGVTGSQQGLEYIELSKFRRVRKLILTNTMAPEHSFKTTKDRFYPAVQIREEAHLVCRCKFVVFYPRGGYRELNRWTEKAVVFLRWAEADPCCRTLDDEMRFAWRGETLKGGSEVELAKVETGSEWERIVRGPSANSRSGPRVHSTLYTDSGRNPSEATPSSRWSSPTRNGRKLSGNLGGQATSLSSGPGARGTSPINLDPDSPTSRRGRENVGGDRGVRNLKFGYQSRNEITQAKCSFAALNLTDNGGDIQETESPSRWTREERFSVASPDAWSNKRLRTARAASPGFYEILHVDKSRTGTIETRFNFNQPFTPATVGPREASSHRMHSVSITPTGGRRKRDSEEDDIQEITAEKFRGNSRPSTPRTLSSDTSFVPRNRQPFSPNHSKPALHRDMPQASNNETEVLVAEQPSTPHRPPVSPPRQFATPRPRSHLAPTVTAPLTSQRAIKRTESKQISRYTFGDAFCGAGGTSRGAEMAGFKIKWGFDCDRNAIKSYRLNFSQDEDGADGASADYMSVHDFIALTSENHKVDVVHLSPPCQTFSTAHTVPGKYDEVNSAALFAIDKIVEKTRPRIATLEQTSGIVERHTPHFHAMVNMLTSHHFSVRWRVVNMLEYGLTQARMRLIIIASCPGEPLPYFATRTHSPSAPVTVNQVIGNIPREPFMHEVENAKARNEPARSGPMATITCSGGGNIHPSGTRDLTLREFACLQGFPLHHQFAEVGTKKQIGNAVPPVVAQIFYAEIVKFLKKVDGV